MEMLKTKTFTLAALIKGDSSASKVAILMPGRLDTKDYANFVSHLDFLAGKGYYAVAIDPPGTWDSPGGLEIYTTSSYLQAINELIELLGNRPTLLLGHSRGGATAMLASRNPAVNGLVVVNAAYGTPHPPDQYRVKDGLYAESRDLPPGTEHTLEQRKFDLPIAYFEDGALHNPLAALNEFKGPKLLVHANRDEFVTMDRVNEIYANLSEPKMFLELDSTHDYRLFPEAIRLVEAKLAEFIEKL